MVRRTVSLTLFFSFLFLLVSAVVLYDVPEGRLANWIGWTALGLSKEEWTAVHITGGILFLIAGIWHTVLNIRPIIAYMKGRAKGGLMPLCIAMLLFSTVYIGTLNGWQPMQAIMDENASLKSEYALVYGDPPYGKAELSSLQALCGAMRMDVDAVLKGLRERGLKGELKNTSTLAEIASANDMPPVELYRIILKDAGLTEAQARAMLSSGSGKGQGRGRSKLGASE
jgi:hypothetical protein